MKNALVLCLVVAVLGCQQGSRKQTDAQDIPMGTDVIDAVGLRSDLGILAENFAATVAGTADTIAENTDDRVIRERTLDWKIYLVPRLRSAAANPDPRVAFVEVWALCALAQRHFSDPDAAPGFGDQQHLAVTALNQMAKQVAALGHQHFTKEQMDKASKEIEQFSKTAKVDDKMAVKQSAGPLGQIGSGLGNILRAPLSPFKGMEGIGHTPAAINQFTAVANSFSQVVAGLPELTRWHIEMILLQLDSLDTVVDLREDVDRLTVSVESVAKMAEELPAELHKKIDGLLDSVDEAQVELRKTLEQVDHTVAGVEQLATTADDITVNAAKAAVAWEATVGQIDAVARIVDKWIEPSGVSEAAPTESSTSDAGGSEGSTAFDIEDYIRAAEKVESATAELRSLLEDLESEELTAAVTRAGEASKPSIDYAVGEMDALVDMITSRVILAIGALLVALVLYRVVAVRLIRPAA